MAPRAQVIASDGALRKVGQFRRMRAGAVTTREGRRRGVRVLGPCSSTRPERWSGLELDWSSQPRARIYIHIGGSIGTLRSSDSIGTLHLRILSVPGGKTKIAVRVFLLVVWYFG